jgi:hypothetical protein
MSGLNKVLAIIGMMLIILGCSKTTEHGAAGIRLTASNSMDFMKVNVEILGVDVKFGQDKESSRGWVSLDTRPGIYDLVSLENDLGIVLANKERLVPAKIVQIRLRLGIKNSILVNGTSYPMHLPDDIERMVHIDLKTEVMPGKRTEVTLQADIGKSVRLHDNGAFSFHPAIHVKRITVYEL